MAFNPLKNKHVENDNLPPEPIIYDDELLTYSDNTSIPAPPPQPIIYDGNKISDLQESGLKTISLLKLASTNVENQTFNIALLKTLPFAEIFKEFEATETTKNNYHFLGHDISVNLEKNSWFNKKLAKGSSNSLNLTKHLIAIKDNINEADNDKSLFILAGKFLNLLHKHLNIKKTDNPINEQPKNTSTPSEVKKNYLTIEEKREQWALQKARDKDITEQLNLIPLNLILDYIGANRTNVADRWEIDSTGDKIGLYGNNQWNNFTITETGTGGISLLANVIKQRDNLFINSKQEENALWYQARNELLVAFADEIEHDAIKDMKINIKLKETFYMPHVLDFKINEVRNYLHEKRGLPKWIINKQIQKGTLFAGAPSDWSYIPFLNIPEKLSNEYVWAVFLSVNGQGAEMRAIERTDGNAKIMAAGTIKNTGGFQVLPEADCNEKIIASVEAAIDSVSYHALFPGRSASSCMGVTVNLAVDTAFKALNYPAWKYQLAFDNDKAGNEAAVRFQDEMIEELGNDDYNELVNTGRISYFPLGILCVKECLAQNKIFYFDVNADAIGRKAAIMFQQQLSKVIPMTEIKRYIQEGKIKYANICPNWDTVHDPIYEAKQAISLLSDGKPFYLRIKDVEINFEDSNKAREKQKILIERKELFEKTFKELAKEKYNEWENSGKIIYEKIAIAKDWNEYLIYIKNKPEVKAVLDENEKKYGLKYSSQTVVEVKQFNRKKP